MFQDMFTAEAVTQALDVLRNEIPFAIWETFYVTVLSTALAVVLGLPLGVLLVAGDSDGVRPLPKPVMSLLNVIINLLRSIPFLILMIMVFPLSRLIVGTSVGTVATIVPLVVASFPFVARLVEGSLREVNPNIIEAAQSMGATPFQIIWKVMLPGSVPSLISNFTGLLRHERHHRRRRSGTDCHQLRLLSLQIPDHADCCHSADHHCADLPNSRHQADHSQRQTAEIKSTHQTAKEKSFAVFLQCFEHGLNFFCNYVEINNIKSVLPRIFVNFA